MFDLRYHVASLAAVFIALAVGIVIGVAIASGGGVEDTTRDILQGDKDRLEQQLETARERLAQSEERQRANADLLEEAYPALIDGRLAGTEVAVLFLGPIQRSVSDAIAQTLADAGAGDEPVRQTALELPVDPAALETLIADDPTLAAFGTEGGLGGLGRGLGREFVDGGSSPVWEAVDEQIVEESFGSTIASADAVVVVRSWAEPDEIDSPEEQAAVDATNDLLDGIVEGLEDASVPVVGVERTSVGPSSIEFFRDRGVSSVNNVETLSGHIALAVVLAGGRPGNYGVGDGAPSGVSPPIEPVLAPTVVE